MVDVFFFLFLFMLLLCSSFLNSLLHCLFDIKSLNFKKNNNKIQIEKFINLICNRTVNLLRFKHVLAAFF